MVSATANPGRFQAPTFAIWAMEIHALGPPGPLRVLKENQQEPHGTPQDDS